MKKLSRKKASTHYIAGWVDAKGFRPDDDRIVVVCCDRGINATARNTRGKWHIQEEYAKNLNVLGWAEDIS